MIKRLWEKCNDSYIYIYIYDTICGVGQQKDDALCKKCHMSENTDVKAQGIVEDLQGVSCSLRWDIRGIR